MSNPTTGMWIQYTHLDKLYGYLPGMVQSMPAIFGLDPAAHAELVALFDTHAEQAAQQLLANDSFAALVDALPFGADESVLALLGGNDITRVGPEPTKPQVSLAESVANLRELRRIAAAQTDASWVWMTSLAGQTAIVTALVQRLTASSPGTGPPAAAP